MRMRVFSPPACSPSSARWHSRRRPAPRASTACSATVMTGAAEVPGPGDADGIGAAVITIDTDADRICWLLAVKRIQLPAAAAHIHVGPTTVAGPVVVGLTAPNAFGISFGCTNNANADAIAADPAAYYVNVHTADFPAPARFAASSAESSRSGARVGRAPLQARFTRSRTVGCRPSRRRRGRSRSRRARCRGHRPARTGHRRRRA